MPYNVLNFDCRTGHNVKLTIREEVPGGDEKLHTNEVSLEGPYSIFNLDKDKSKLCLGSCLPEFKMQPEVPVNPFEGEMEDLVIGDIPVGLWNFDEGYDNNRGAKERLVIDVTASLRILHKDHDIIFRDKLINLKRSTGYRFNGQGFTILNARSYNFRQKLDLQLKFKTFETEGLLFLLGKEKTFIALELRNGKILYKVNQVLMLIQYSMNYAVI